MYKKQMTNVYFEIKKYFSVISFQNFRYSRQLNLIDCVFGNVLLSFISRNTNALFWQKKEKKIISSVNTMFEIKMCVIFNYRDQNYDVFMGQSLAG